MARAYYKEEKLCGTPVCSKIIDVYIFDYIIDNCSTGSDNISHSIQLTDKKESFFDVFKSNNKQKPFRYAMPWNDGFYYNSSEYGNLFLPKSIIFFDVDDASYPTEYYFLAKIGNQIELRRCEGGKNVEWFNTLDKHVEETHPRVIARIEQSLLALKELVETLYNKQTEASDIYINSDYKVSEPISDDIKEAFLQLADISMPKNERKSEVLGYIDNLCDDGYSPLDSLIGKLDDNDIHFIMRLDWKSGIEDLVWRIESAMKDNFHMVIQLPSEKDFSKDATISDDNVFEIFDAILRKNDFQISFIDTQSDEYILLIHPTGQKEGVKFSVNKIGYEYNEAE